MLPWFLRQNTKVAPDRCCNFRVRCSHSRTLCHSSSAVLAVSNYVVSMKKKIDDNFNEPPQVSHLEWFDWPSCKKLRLQISTICNADWKQVLPFARRQFSRSTTVGLSPGNHLYRCYDTTTNETTKHYLVRSCRCWLRHSHQIPQYCSTMTRLVQQLLGALQSTILRSPSCNRPLLPPDKWGGRHLGARLELSLNVW